MSDTPETPNPDAATEATPVTTPPAAESAAASTAASPKRGIWKFIGAGAVGLVVGLLVAGGVAWGLIDDHHDGRKASRPLMSQHQDQRGQMQRGGGNTRQMPGGQGQFGSPGQQDPQAQQGPQAQQAPDGSQTQPSGPMGGMKGARPSGAN